MTESPSTPDPTPPDRRTLLLYGAAVLLVQLVLMAGVWISAPHNGGDNAGYVALAHALLEGRGYVEAWDPAMPVHTKYPPVFPALLAVAVAVGARTWAALKVIPAAATTAAVLLTYLWVARRRDPFSGALVALLLSAGSGLLWYSHWVLSDVPFLALTMLALVALERADAPEPPGWPEGGGRRGEAAGDSPERAPRPTRTAWLAVGLVAAVLAYFTRSAGLPLLVAVAAWLALRTRWRALGAYAAVAGVPAVLWWLRGRSGGADYVAEFWMVDPYTPDLGTVGLTGLMGRALDNAGLYATRHVPQGLMGAGGRIALVLGLAILALAVLGWGMRFVPAGSKRRVHVAELFLPLYAGLILLWPQVWSGDRFALPLFPLLLFYAGDALARLVRRLEPRAVGVACTVAALAVAVPAGLAWSQARENARGCADLMRSVGAGPFACHGPTWESFVDAARWSGANLPENAAVLTRKPRIFWVMGGTRSRTYPFTTDPTDFADAAADAGARYVLLDLLGRQAATYVGAVLQARPGSFCSLASFGERRTGISHLLGLSDPTLGTVPQPGGGEGLRIVGCSGELAPDREVTPEPLTGLEIPLLTRESGG